MLEPARLAEAFSAACEQLVTLTNTHCEFTFVSEQLRLGVLAKGCRVLTWVPGMAVVEFRARHIVCPAAVCHHFVESGDPRLDNPRSLLVTLIVGDYRCVGQLFVSSCSVTVLSGGMLVMDYAKLAFKPLPLITLLRSSWS